MPVFSHFAWIFTSSVGVVPEAAVMFKKKKPPDAFRSLKSAPFVVAVNVPETSVDSSFVVGLPAGIQFSIKGFQGHSARSYSSDSVDTSHCVLLSVVKITRIATSLRDWIVA